MQTTVLVTGGTGFLGTETIGELLKEGASIVVLIRGSSPEDAALRLKRVWWDHPEIAQSIGSGIRVAIGDVRAEELGLSEQDRRWIVENVTHILHSAADIRLMAPQAELDETNVQGIRNVLDLAEEINRHHRLLRFGHISTAYVAGDRQGTILEDALPESSTASNTYEASKFRAESAVRERMGRLPISIFRPGMVVGNSRTGQVRTFNTIYYPLRLYLTGRLRLFPISPHLGINLVPVDYVAGAMAKLLLMPEAEGLTFHLTAPSDRSPSAAELFTQARGWAMGALRVRLPRPLFIPMPEGLRNRLIGLMGGDASNLALLTPYFRQGKDFSRTNVDRLLGTYQMDWRMFLPSLLDYAAYSGFLHRTGRTVHEQVLFRLSQKRRRIRCHDIEDGKVVEVPTDRLRSDMLRVASALGKLGIQKGDRVAMVGWNSSRYLTLDVGIGLAGAVSVPLYYTSPARDIAELCQAAEVKALFVGTKDILAQVQQIGFQGKVVSFCPDLHDPESGIISWHDFLASGDEKEVGLAPVAPDDLSTLRFTSSTTGKAKAARFSHRQLLYMAESMASLPPWESRHRPVRYLSYLPMNHVVEGILATYAPYYAPTQVDIFFLEKFGGLRAALPSVRPTVFFSVPRFYEKLWDTINESGIGSRAMKLSLVGKLLRPFVRRSVLKKAGLDACDHLIVGSGPVSEDQLRDFQRLGVEVHNAYGLTEAPLVTLNRKGSNRIGTVGQPLPMTEVRIAEDGEVLVRGPQVTSGYEAYDGSQPFVDGWLRTGDLGRIEDGYLIIQGRKKELIKTSYGKFVSPMLVESMLRDSPLIAEAMLVGEGRPYCIALLWIENKEWHEETAGQVAALIGEVNSRLSQPERPRRWAVMNGSLSVDQGELTANLKLRRSKVEARYASLIAALYAGAKEHEDSWHIGKEEER